MRKDELGNAIDHYWNIVNDGYNSHDALTQTCVDLGFSSHDEDDPKKLLKIVAD